MKYILNTSFFFMIYIYLIKPRLRREVVFTFLGKRFAHRGLHDEMIPENSLPSFNKAIEHGVGIELDIQLTADNKVVVFHDYDLMRAVGVEKRIKDLTLAQLREYEVFNTTYRIPTLEETLNYINARVPLLIDLKPSGIFRDLILCRKVKALLDKYEGEYCIESFSPLFLLWFRIRKPKIARGLLMCRIPYKKNKRYFLFILIMRSMIFNALARPDFIAYDYSHKPLLSIRLCRFIFRIPVFAWTVPESLLEDKLLAKYNSFIYETQIGFDA